VDISQVISSSRSSPEDANAAVTSSFSSTSPHSCLKYIFTRQSHFTMEATLTSALSRAAEGAHALYEEGLNLIYPDAAVKATFRRLDAPPIPRSSHTLNVVQNRAFIFGGEISPRQPVNASMNVITLPNGDGVKCRHEVVEGREVDGGKSE